MRASITASVLALLASLPSGARAQDQGSSPEDDSITICEQTIAEQLGEAGDLQWPRREEYRVRHRDGGDYVVDGWVDRLGPLGAVRRAWTCVASSYGSRWRANAQLAGEGAAQASAPPPPAAPQAMPEPGAPRRAEAPSPDAEVTDPAGRCRGIRFLDVTRQVRFNPGVQTLRGRVQNFGARPVRELRICAGLICTSEAGAAPSMPNGATASFTLEVPGLQEVALEARCAAAR